MSKLRKKANLYGHTMDGSTLIIENLFYKYNNNYWHFFKVFQGFETVRHVFILSSRLKSQ